MKYMKILGLLAAAAAALMAFAATASATLTSPTGTTLNKGAKIHAVSEGHITLKPANLPAMECSPTLEFEVGADGGTNGPVASLGFGSSIFTCTNNWHVTTIANGELEIEGDGLPATYNGTVYSKGMTFEATRFGIPCRYATPETTKIGTFTGGNPGTLHIEADLLFHGGSLLCGSGATNWKGSYVTTASLYVDG